jgi:hypothetical protein
VSGRVWRPVGRGFELQRAHTSAARPSTSNWALRSSACSFLSGSPSLHRGRSAAILVRLSRAGVGNRETCSCSPLSL